MNRKGFAPVFIIGIIALVVIAAGVAGWYFFAHNNSTSTGGVACTTDAKQCPDGSYVDRTGPDCAFAGCPTATAAVSSTSLATGVSSTTSSTPIDISNWEVYQDPQFTMSIPQGWPATTSFKSATSSSDDPSRTVNFWVADLPVPILEIMIYPHGFNSFQNYDEPPAYLGTDGTSDFYYDQPNGNIDASVMAMLYQSVASFKVK